MCVKDASFPFIVPVTMNTTSTGIKVLTVSLLMGKVTTLRNGEHISSWGLRYPIRQTIHDTKAQIGSHNYGLHFAATPACTIGLPDEFGSHRLAVLPSPQVWDPITEAAQKKEASPPRCWHSDACTPLFCMDCWNLKIEDLNNPDFWQAFKTCCAKSDDFDITMSVEQIWRRQIVLTDS
jgi:hypothetical protein